MSAARQVTPFVDWPDELVLVLASRSPRRAELLTVAGIPHEVRVPPEVESDLAAELQGNGVSPDVYARELAAAKSGAVSDDMPGRLVLGADTIVVLDGEILEKPRDEQEARELLGRLSGRTHTVISAVALRGGPAGPDGICSHVSTEVTFLDLDPGTIAAYVESGEPMDKAGAYGIQGLGALMVREVRGCYFNVMGLPLARLGEMLREILG